jgi:hypothetical protein
MNSGQSGSEYLYETTSRVRLSADATVPKTIGLIDWKRETHLRSPEPKSVIGPTAGIVLNRRSGSRSSELTRT